MLKIKNITIVLIALFVVAVTSSSVFGATLTKVKYDNSRITVSGTCTTSDQVTIAIFDSNKQPIYFGTVRVENGKFNSILPASFDLEEGKTFTVKTSDYNGQGVSEDTFFVEKVDPNEKDDTPKTGTLEYIGIVTLAIVVSNLGMSVLKSKKA